MFLCVSVLGKGGQCLWGRSPRAEMWSRFIEGNIIFLLIHLKKRNEFANYSGKSRY